MILACQNISKAFGTTEIIKNASFHIEEREKAALVGINGAGKSTLLKIIIGEMRADEGEVILSKGKTMGYLAQHQDLTGHLSIYQEVLTAKQNLIDMEERLRQMESDMKTKSGAGRTAGRGAASPGAEASAGLRPDGRHRGERGHPRPAGAGRTAFCLGVHPRRRIPERLRTHHRTAHLLPVAAPLL